MKDLADRSVDDSVCFPSHDQDKFPDTDSIQGVDEQQPLPVESYLKKRKGKLPHISLPNHVEFLAVLLDKTR